MSGSHRACLLLTHCKRRLSSTGWASPICDRYWWVWTLLCAATSSAVWSAQSKRMWLDTRSCKGSSLTKVLAGQFCRCHLYMTVYVCVSDSTRNMRFLQVDTSNLKATLMSLCQQWQIKFTTYLNQQALEELTAVHKHFQTSAQKLSKSPTTLEQLGEMMQQLKADQV